MQPLQPSQFAGVRAGTVVLDEPPVRARCDGSSLPVGERIDVRLAEADVAARTVRTSVMSQWYSCSAAG
jgi:RNase II-type exonuclease C-terminal S1 domain